LIDVKSEELRLFPSIYPLCFIIPEEHGDEIVVADVLVVFPVRVVAVRVGLRATEPMQRPREMHCGNKQLRVLRRVRVGDGHYFVPCAGLLGTDVPGG